MTDHDKSEFVERMTNVEYVLKADYANVFVVVNSLCSPRTDFFEELQYNIDEESLFIRTFEEHLKAVGDRYKIIFNLDTISPEFKIKLDEVHKIVDEMNQVLKDVQEKFTSGRKDDIDPNQIKTQLKTLENRILALIR